MIETLFIYPISQLGKGSQLLKEFARFSSSNPHVSTSTLLPSSMLHRVPLEIQHLIYQYLELDDVVALSRVNYSFRQLIKCDNGYLCAGAARNTNRLMILENSNLFAAINSYQKVVTAIQHISQSNNVPNVGVPAVNEIPSEFGAVALAFASEPSFTTNSVHVLNKNQVCASVLDHTKMVVLDFSTRMVKVEPVEDHNVAPGKRLDPCQLECIYHSQNTQAVLYHNTVASIEVMEVLVTQRRHAQAVLYHHSWPFDKSCPLNDAFHYIEPYLFKTGNNRCQVIDTRTGAAVSECAMPQCGWAHSTFVTQTHYWSIAHDGLYTISLEKLICGQAEPDCWTKLLQLEPHMRIESINKFYTNHIALTCEGDALILINLNTSKITLHGFSSDPVRRNHPGNTLYLNGFGVWVIDDTPNSRPLFIRTNYLESIAELYEHQNYRGFVPLSLFNISFNSAGRLV